MLCLLHEKERMAVSRVSHIIKASGKNGEMLSSVTWRHAVDDDDDEIWFSRRFAPARCASATNPLSGAARQDSQIFVLTEEPHTLRNCSCESPRDAVKKKSLLGHGHSRAQFTFCHPLRYHTETKFDAAVASTTCPTAKFGS